MERNNVRVIEHGKTHNDEQEIEMIFHIVVKFQRLLRNNNQTLGIID